MRQMKLKAMMMLLILPAMSLGQAAPKVVAPTSQPTAADVQTLIDAKEYSAAIKLSSKMLSLRGPLVAGMSRFEVTMLKGDAQAGQKVLSTAISTYKSAALETQDPHEQALSHWTAELFRTAGSVIYTPKIAIGMQKRGPFNLMDMDQRKQGFGALLDDNLSALEPKLKVATVSQSLPQIWPVIQQVVDLANLDEIANGSDDKTTAIASTLLDHSRNLLSNLLKEDWARLGDIDTHANTTTSSQSQGFDATGGIISQTVTRKNGLTQSNQSELKEMIATSAKVQEAATELMKFAKSDQGWNTILADANRISGRASDVLNTDYTGVTSQIGGDNPYNTGIYSTGTGIGIGVGGATFQTGQTGPGTVRTAPPPKTKNKPTTQPG